MTLTIWIIIHQHNNWHIHCS